MAHQKFETAYPINIRESVCRDPSDVDNLQRRLLHMSSGEMPFRLNQLQDPTLSKHGEAPLDNVAFHFPPTLINLLDIGEMKGVDKEEARGDERNEGIGSHKNGAVMFSWVLIIAVL